MAKRCLIILVSFLTLMGLALTACRAAAPAPLPTPIPTFGSQLLDEVWSILQEDYIDPSALNPDKLTKDAIKGILEGLNDPYTSYLDKDQFHLWQSSFQGSFEGIGAMVDLEAGRFIIIAPLAGTPAEQAGVRAGDWIQKVDGRSTEGLSLPEAILLVRGPRGTAVTLTILHKDEAEPVEITIVRDTINVASATLVMKGDIAHIRLTTFGERTDEELIAALQEAQRQGARGLVLDLRHNPGGLLDTAVGVASQFLKEGIVLYEGDNKGGREPIEVHHGGQALDIPMVVLVDSASASASEVVAGALHDRGRATIIGTTTFGKGSINHIRVLSDGSAIVVTIARWYTPNGNLIEGVGIAPDIVVERTAEDVAAGRDPPLERALEYLQQRVPALP